MVTRFRDLPEEEQLQALTEVLEQGEPLYGLSDTDDTHVMFAAKMAVHQVRLLSSDDYIVITPLEIGVDEKGLFVSYVINKVVNDAL